MCESHFPKLGRLGVVSSTSPKPKAVKHGARCTSVSRCLAEIKHGDRPSELVISVRARS